ncbi:hypothetical protein BDA99DRAFT_99227 [Phascolomyces articulosus]|uniref:Major facilitator superfamily (MFS) profile domain-containing protein n=1 Tax=Phascolomyces articulosus TaxID=60185 RepID=A0AAD5K7T0_9FUNG|nr:hypothetical protein BDA99DRAFT_99227 [Phascolomyces articulosus]
MVIPLYQSEIAPKDMRGRLVSVQQLAIAFGICTSYWVGYGFIDIDSSLSWRLPLGIPLIVALIYAIGILMMPRSPRYLVHKHMDHQALKSLAFIRGDGSLCHPDVLMEYVEIKQSIRFEETYGSKHYGRLFRKGWENNRKRLLLGMAVQIFQQLTGANSLFLYAPQIFQALGIRGRHSTLLANGISGTINFVFSIPPIFIIDRWGRRPTLVIGSIFCCLCTIVMAIVGAVTGLTDHIRAIYAMDPNPNTPRNVDFITIPGSSDSNGSIAFLVVMYLFIACFALTWGPAGWIFPTELYSQDVRAQALGLTTAANWLFNYGVSQITPIMYVNIRWKTFATYAVLCAVIAFVVYRYFPETKGKSLEEIDLIFSGNFNYYDLNVHHPQTAAAALDVLDRAHARHSHPLEPAVVEGLFADLSTPPVTGSIATPVAHSIAQTFSHSIKISHQESDTPIPLQPIQSASPPLSVKSSPA